MVRKSFDIRSEVTLKENVEIEDALDEAGHGRYNQIMLVTCCVISIGAVMDMLGYSLVVPAASCDLNLTLSQGGILKSISFAGFLFALPWGYLADTRGRRKTILGSLVVSFIFSALASLSTSFSMMLIIKFLASCVTTVSMTLISTYIGESTCRKKRNSYIFIQNISSTGSDFVCFLLGYLVLSLNFALPVPYINFYKPWRLFSLLMSMPLGIGAFMFYFLKETPKFLANKGETDAALEVLKTMFKMNYGENTEYPVKSLLKGNNSVGDKSFWNSVVKQTAPIFKPPLLWRSLQLFLLLSICCSTNNVFFMWFPTLANSFFTTEEENTIFCQKITANLTRIDDNISTECTEENSLSTLYSGMILTLLFTCLNIVALILAEWRRTLIFSIFLISGVSCIIMNMLSDSKISMALFCMVQFTGLCIGTVYSYYNDVFPTSYRGLAIGLGMTVARFVCLGGVALVGTTVINHCELTFYCWAVFIFSGIVAALFLPKDKTKEDCFNE